MDSPAGPAEPTDGRRRIHLQLKDSLLQQVDALKKEWGIRNRGEVLERLLEEVFATGDADVERDGELELATGVEAEGDPEPELDEQLGLVLVGSRALEATGKRIGVEGGEPMPAAPPRRRGGIDLPGFVQRNTQQLRRSIQPGRPADVGVASLPTIPAELVHQAMELAREHWVNLYGQPPNAAVLEAAMLWLARDIWPQSDQSEGRSFTWSAACRAMADLVGDWEAGQPRFEQVIVTAGVLEDPFSASTLPLRIPTLIRSFVQRFKRRRSNTSFAMLEHTMTVQGALKLLQVHPEADQAVTLGQIREAYREMALLHHPDSGGSVEAMRRINEAYQLLKELYRQRPADAAS